MRVSNSSKCVLGVIGWSLFGCVAPVLAQASSCLDDQRALELSIKAGKDSTEQLLASAIASNFQCASELLVTAVATTEGDDTVVAKLVSAAVQAAPGQAVAIAESAISVSPSASDEIAEVVQKVLGDCDSIAEDVSISIDRNRKRMLVILEDSLRSYSNCACKIVTSVIRAAESNNSVITQIIETAVKAAPSKAAEISECAVAAAPKAIAAIQKGLDHAVSDAERGPGALAAEAEIGQVEDISLQVSQSEGDLDSNQGSEQSSSQTSYGEHGIQSSGKNGHEKNGSFTKEPEPENEQRWDWIPWGVAGTGVYLIAPAGGVVPPGELVPLSPSDPKLDDKND